MATRLRFLPAFLSVGVTAALIAGCNMFGFTSDSDKSPLDKAEQSIRDGNYSQAKKDLTDENGVLKDSTNSMVLYTYSKALLLESGLTIARIVDLVQADKSTDANNNLALLAEIDNQDYSTQTAWYRANQDIAQKLSAIWKGNASGQMTKDDIALDYSISNILGGVLSLRDTNRDLVINDQDFKINLTQMNLGGGAEGFNFNGIQGKDNSGQAVTFKGLTAFLGTPVGKVAKPAGISGYTPDDINPLISTFLGFLGGGEESISFFVNNLAEQTSYDPREIRKIVYDLARVINFYWYNDGMDNDGDGRTDEEIIDGIDNDKDGLTDEDSGYMAGYDPTNTINTLYVPLYETWKNKVLTNL